MSDDARLAATLRRQAIPLSGDDDIGPIILTIGDAQLVLLGEASHGTHEFYATRAAVTRRLIERHGFSAVTIEGDWPDAYRVHRFVRGHTDDDPAMALSGFQRFPTWMWRNTVVLEFIGWLRQHNATRTAGGSAGFYGLDLYSLRTSIQEVIRYLEQRDPTAARAARACFACFEQYGPDPDDYARWVRSMAGDCEDAVTRQLLVLHDKRAELMRRLGTAEAEHFFDAEQNARLAVNAERYYRSMFSSRTRSWNLRDEHMFETLEEILSNLRRRAVPPKVVIWAHNSHLGDARATEMGSGGQLNLGQLVRERYADAARLIGFTTHTGTVVAASDWGEPAQIKRVKPSLRGSYEALFHELRMPRFLLPMSGASEAAALLRERRLERAIGVIYRPETERQSHYFDASLSAQFDAVIHVDESHALTPLDVLQPPLDREPAETFPSGV